MATLTDYKDLDVLSIDQDDTNITGEGGRVINDDFLKLADRAPMLSVYDPSTSDDEDAGFFPGSLWLNETTETMWVCIDATSGDAEWKSLFRRDTDMLVLVPEGDGGVQLGDGGVQIGDFEIEDNKISTTVTNGDVVIDMGAAGLGTLRIVRIRPVELGNTGFHIQANTGGWIFGYLAKGSAETDLGGFGFYGSNDTLVRYWIGPSFPSPHIATVAATGNVGIGTVSPATKLQVEGGLTLMEVSNPSTPAANHAALYLEDDGSGNQLLKVKFANDEVKIIADDT